ncbi:MAG: PAS domain S-box protein [Fimbriimonadaceae bacterium]|nr:PAS domain S-box protein [Fimbriimonadaceae bacterium]
MAERINELEGQVASAKSAQKMHWYAARRFEELFHAVPAACYTHDASGKIYEFNRAAEHLWGIEAFEIFEKSVYGNLVGPKATASYIQVVERVLRGESVTEFEWEFDARDGTTHYLISNFFPARNLQNEIVSVSCATLDVTQIKVGEIERYRTSELVRQFVQHSPAPIAMFDTDMRFLVASDRWKSEFIGHAMELEGQELKDASPNLAERWQTQIVRALHGVASSKEDDPFEDVVTGGTSYYRWDIRPWRDQSGEVGGCIILCEDVTDRWQANQTILEGKAKLAEAQRVAKLGYWSYDVQSDRGEWAEELYAIHGLAKPDCIPLDQEKFFSLILPEDVERAKTVVEKAKKSETEFTLEYRIHRSDGETRYVLCRGKSRKTQSGMLLEGTAQDITDLKENELRLIEAQSRIASFIATSPTILYCVSADGTFACTYVSENVERVLGYAPEQFCGDLKSWTDRIHPNDKAAFDTQWQGVAEGKPFRCEYRSEHADGSYRWIVDEINLVRDSSGDPFEYVGSRTDITEQKQAEENLRLLSSVAETSSSGIFVFDASFRLKYVNTAFVKLVSSDAEDLVGKSAEEILTQFGSEEHAIRVLRQVFRNPKPTELELSVNDRYGDKYWFELVLNPVLDPEGKLTHFIAVAHNITDRKLVEHELQTANKRLEALASTDGLTGVQNNRAFRGFLELELQAAHAAKRPLSIILLDVDKFKSFNDSFGHLAGDEVLKGVADTLLDACRAGDFVARYGGEEFVVVLPGADEERAIAAAERIRTAIERVVWPHRQVTASFGVATVVGRCKDIEKIISEADKALYASKDAGRNCTTHFRHLAKKAA